MSEKAGERDVWKLDSFSYRNSFLATYSRHTVQNLLSLVNCWLVFVFVFVLFFQKKWFYRV